MTTTADPVSPTPDASVDARPFLRRDPTNIWERVEATKAALFVWM